MTAISHRVMVPPRPIPTVDELRAAPPSRFEQDKRCTGPDTYAALRVVDYAEVATRFTVVERDPARTERTERLIAVEFDCSVSTVRRALRKVGAR